MLTMTWKMKKRVINDSSMPEYFGIPSNRARRRRINTVTNINSASSTGGRIPAMMPTTIFGRVHIHASQLRVEQSL